MTVAELIAKLQEFPHDMQVMTPGYDEWDPRPIGEPKVVERKGIKVLVID